MLVKNLISSKPHLLRWFSTLEPPRVLRTGDVLRQRRVYSNEDIVEYSKPGAVYVSQSLHFRSPVYVGDVILGEVQAINIRENKKRYIVKFSTKCVKNDSKILVLDGEAMAILPTLAMEQVESSAEV